MGEPTRADPLPRDAGRPAEAAATAAAGSMASPPPGELPQLLALLRGVADALPVLVAYVDGEGRYRYNNRAYEAWFGLDPAFLAGAQVRDVAGEAAYETLLPCMERAAAGECVRFEGRLAYRYGAARSVEVTMVPAGAPGGGGGFFEVVVDVSEQRAAERAAIDDDGKAPGEHRERLTLELERALAGAEQARAELDAVLRITPVGIVFVDREVRFTRVNDAAAEINGLPAEEHIGRAFEDVLPDLASQRELFERVMERGIAINDVEVAGSTPAAPGVARYWLASYYPVPGPDGSIVGAGVVFREITEMKRAALERERLLEDLRTANATKDEFLGLVSHELRTPITTILGNAQVLRTRAQQLDAGARDTALHDIEREAQRLHGIIENLLVLARLDKGQGLPVEPVFVRRVLRECIEEFTRRTHRGVELEVPEEYAFVMADAVYIRQVVENLLSNAHKYSPGDEHIVMRMSREDDEVRVRVLDHGAGFTTEDAAMLFEPFFRSSRTAREVSGVGIGLAVCNRIIEALGGRMWALPREGGGAEVGFALPIIDDEHSD